MSWIGRYVKRLDLGRTYKIESVSDNGRTLRLRRTNYVDVSGWVPSRHINVGDLQSHLEEGRWVLIEPQPTPVSLGAARAVLEAP